MGKRMTKITRTGWVERHIIQVRGQRVMLSPDLAELYGVEPRVLVQAVKRNIDRFPADFMFQLTRGEFNGLKSQIVTLDRAPRATPYAFTEHGVAMLSAVLNSERAVQVSILIVRAFVHVRKLLAANVEVSHRLDELEKKYDGQFAMVFDAIRALMAETAEDDRRPRIGYETERKGT
jgi:hypothetical protein